MPSEGLFAPIFTTPAMQETVSDAAILQAMLDAEAALARAQARAGLIPEDAAAEIARACRHEGFDPDEVGRAAVAAGNPVVPLVRMLTEAVAGEAARYVHWGATSQDILDTAAMLVVGRALDLLIPELGGVAARCAELADAHRTTVMAGRTLLQQATPITFGLKAAGWLWATVDARERLADLRRRRLVVQLGGAAGTLAALGPHGPDVLHHFAGELGLGEPVVPWHTARAPVVETATALGLAAGAMGKIALDVALLMQTEVAEASEAPSPGRGGSSTMPHKRNPAGSASVAACVRRVHGQVGVLLGSMAQEHERAMGAWQAEWEPLREVLALTGGAVSRMREVLDGLEIDPARMGRNLELTGGLLLAEPVMMALAPQMGRLEAHTLVAEIASRSRHGGGSFRDELLADVTVAAHMSPDDVDKALDPAGWLGSSDTFIDRALEFFKELYD